MRVRTVIGGLMLSWGLVAASLVLSPAAQADSVWFQSVARASASASCPDDAFGTPWQSNWDPEQRPWRPSWAQWPNGGTGGFTCDRQITWAKSTSPYPSAGCVRANSWWTNFNGGWSLATALLYSDPDCTTPTGSSFTDVVYSPSGWNALTLCTEAFGSAVTSPGRFVNSDVWSCTGAG